MSSHDHALIRLAHSVADGRPVDWRQVADLATDDESRRLIGQLQLVAGIPVSHRRSDLPTGAGMSTPIAVANPPAGVQPAPLERWGDLVLLERVGSGSFSTVFRAWDARLARDVAVKLFDDERHATRLMTEARLLARVRHPNVITVYAVDRHGGRPGLWMDLVRGTTLEQRLKAQGPSGAPEATLIGLEICRALAAVHAVGLLHCDVKAQNVMREEGGRIVLMDFGAGQERRGAEDDAPVGTAGTPLYLAPEVLLGGRPSVASDIYSLGVLLYRLVTHSFPVQARSIDELVDAHREGRRHLLRDARPDLPERFVRVVERATAADPRDRYQSAGAMEADLSGGLGAAQAAPQSEPRPEASVRPQPIPAPAVPTAASRPRLARPWIVVPLLAALAAVAGLLGSVLSRRTDAPALPDVRSLAVLPLANLSRDAAQDYLVDAMTDELITTLGGIPDLNVISRTSVTRIRGDERTSTEIAESLQVDAIVRGSVRFPGHVPGTRPARALISAQLIHGRTGSVLWRGDFEELIGEALEAQSRVARAVADEIRRSFVPRPARMGVAPRRTDPEAQDAYLRGRHLLNEFNRDSTQRAREHLERAVAIDPRYARAYASLADCYVLLNQYGALPRNEAHQLASVAATRAVALDDELAEAHVFLGNVRLYYDWDWTKSGVAYKRAIDANPSHSFGRSQYGLKLAAEGHLEQALRETQRALELDPLSADTGIVAALVLYYARRHDEAIALYERVRGLDVSARVHIGLGRALAEKRDFRRALAELERAVQMSGGHPGETAELARTYAAAGDPDRARRLLAGLSGPDRVDTAGAPNHLLAAVHAALGDNDRAFALLDQAVAEREPGVLWAKVDPRLDPLRRDPRFAALVRGLGLAD